MIYTGVVGRTSFEWGLAIVYLKEWTPLMNELVAVEKFFVIAVMPIGVLCVAAEIAIVFGYIVELSPFVYVGVMIHLLSVGLMNFLSLLLRSDE